MIRGDDHTKSAFADGRLRALEMALHEDQERRVLEGELAGLEAMWRQAEEIAANRRCPARRRLRAGAAAHRPAGLIGPPSPPTRARARCTTTASSARRI
jgi:hypothetical protein